MFQLPMHGLLKAFSKVILNHRIIASGADFRTKPLHRMQLPWVLKLQDPAESQTTALRHAHWQAGP